MGKTSGNNVGIPIPKLIFIPFLTYFAALLIILSLFYWAGSISTWACYWVMVLFSILFSDQGQFGFDLKILSTYTAAMWTSSGSICPGSTIYYTSTITFLADVAMSALKFLAVLLKYKLPNVSAFWALIKAKSPKIVSSSTYFLPLKVLTFFGCEKISTYLLPFVNYRLYLIGKPPCSTKVPTPVPVKNAGMPAPPDLIF